MAFVCKGECNQSFKSIVDGIEFIGRKRGMINISPKAYYSKTNRCTKCSDHDESIWYLKHVNRCPCCSSPLRKSGKKNTSKPIINTLI